MSIEVTYHGKRPFDKADPANVLRAQPVGSEGDMFVVADGQRSAAVRYSGLYRFYALSDSRVRVGEANMANAAGGARFDASSVEVWWLDAGTIIFCDAVI